MIIKKLKERKNRADTLPVDEESERCNHVFMPIDSTGEILACKNCGVLIKKENLKKYKK
ncbi:hypothetical protein J6S88_07800 [bacterium]|nr:hypothetical protein [bacterium]